MTDPSPDRTGLPRVGFERGPAPAPDLPRWVKLLGLVTLVLILVFAGLHLADGGFGPGSHGSSSGVAEHGGSRP